MFWRKTRRQHIGRRYLLFLLLLGLASFFCLLHKKDEVFQGCATITEEEQISRPSRVSNDVNQSKNELEMSGDNFPIHLVMVVGGAQAARQISTFLKSLVYHTQWMNTCHRGNASQNLEQQKTVGEVDRFHQFHLHLIVDSRAFVSLETLLHTWELPGVKYSLYSFHDYEHEISWIPTTHYSGNFGLSKLLLPNILPDEVEKVIGLDVDLLMNADITELWSWFDRLSYSQIIGLVRNQSPWYLQEKQNTIWPALGCGYNTGVMLLHLQRMRSIGWMEVWKNVTKTTLEYLDHAPLADQDVINAVLVQMPEAVFELPCEWNVQLNARAQAMQCPVNWLTVQKSASTIPGTQLKIAHYNSPIKPELLNQAFTVQENFELSPQGLGLRTKYVQQYRFFQNYDGQLLKQLVREHSLKGCEHHELQDAQALLSNKCSELTLQSQIHHRVHPFYLQCEVRPETQVTKFTEGYPGHRDSDVTLVSQLTFDRIHRLTEIAKRWNGPMSLAIYVTDRDAVTLVDFVSRSQILSNRTNICYHVVFLDGILYPINRLRNVAMQFAQTEYIFLIDVDFIPSSNMYHELKEKVALQARELKENWSFVVPAFETFGEHIQLPETKQALLIQWEQSLVVPFRHQIWTAGHMATDYQKWRNISDMYEVFWSADYEPYLVVPRNALQFDERFVGFGWNKASFVMALDALGYRFFVLPNVYILHLPHPSSIEVLRFRSDSTYRSCVDKIKLDYITQLAKKHGVRALKYLDFRKDTATP